MQWKTAGSGLVHEEFHGREYAKLEGPFEMIQLWVNLPKKDKLTRPGYQGITHSQIPAVELPDGAGVIRIFAGEHAGARAPANTFSPMNVWGIRLKAGHAVKLDVTDGWTTGLFVLGGAIRLLPGKERIGEAALAVLERSGTEVAFEVLEDTKMLFLNGKPLNEPIVGHGPFVMNTSQEIQQALADYQSGKMGRLVRN